MCRAAHLRVVDLLNRAGEIQHMALAGSTTTQYSAHVRYFCEFCVYTACGQCFDRPTEQFIMAYVTHVFQSVRASTVVQYLKGLKDFYRARGFPEFATPEAWPQLHRTLKGMRRVDAGAPKKKQPITPEMLAGYRQCMDLRRADHSALWACCLVTFFGYFRKSNTSVQSGCPLAQGKCLRVSDVQIDGIQYALVVSVRTSKTRQFGQGPPPIRIAGLRGHALDPVEAWRSHVDISRLSTAAMAVYQAFSYRVHDGGVKALLHADLVGAAKHMAGLLGVDPATVAGHSFRRGGASYAFRAGVPDVLIQHQGDWRSMAYREYLTLSPAKALEATRAMFSLMQRPAGEGGFGAGVLQVGLQPVDNAVGARGALGLAGPVASPVEV